MCICLRYHSVSGVLMSVRNLISSSKEWFNIVITCRNGWIWELYFVHLQLLLIRFVLDYFLWWTWWIYTWNDNWNADCSMSPTSLYVASRHFITFICLHDYIWFGYVGWLRAPFIAVCTGTKMFYMEEADFSL